MRDGKSRPGLRTGLRDYGFVIILIAVMAVFSLTTTTFLTLENILSLLHESVPLAIMGLGLALVVMTGKLDISIGSIAFLSSAVGMLLMAHNGLPAEIGLPLIVLVGTACGLVNGLACVYLRVNPLITTMGGDVRVPRPRAPAHLVARDKRVQGPPRSRQCQVGPFLL